MNIRWLHSAVCASILINSAAISAAADYPARPIRLIAPFAPGQKAGVMKLMQHDKLIVEIPVVALENVPVAGLLGRGWDAIRLLFK